MDNEQQHKDTYILQHIYSRCIHPYPGFLQGGLLRQIASVIFDAKNGLFESIHATTKAEPCTSES